MTAQRVTLVLATSAGGTGRHVRVLAEHLTAAGREVTVCGPAATDATFDFGAAGARFQPVEIASGPRPVADASAVRRLRGFVRDADVVHAHGLRAGLLAGFATPRRTPYVVTWHNTVLAGGSLRRVYALLERVVARRAGVTLCVSPDLVERVRELGGRDVRLAPVSAPELPPALHSRAENRAALGVGERPVLLTVGRLHPQKGYPTLLAAARMLADRVPQPLFLAAGDGPLREELASRIAASRAPLRLLGRREDVADLLSAADVVVLPSIWEGSPLAAQEALRAGLPFVGTAVGGVPALVGDGGLLVPPRDPGALAAAIAKVLDDPDFAASLGERAREAAAALPTDESVVGQIEGVYAELSGGG